MAQVERVLIVGAGIGGLGAAAALGQRGVDVEVVEVKPEADVFGVGINQPANSLRALRQLGVLPDVLAAGFQFDRMAFHDYRGEPIVEVRSRLGGDGVPANCALPRRDLHQILISAAEAAGAEIRYGTSVSELDEAGDGIAAGFTSGGGGSYDLLAAFDGIGSAMRRRLFGNAREPVYSGYAVWRVTVPRPPGADAAALFQSPRNKGGYIPLTAETMYLLLVTEEPEGARYAKKDLADLLRERLAEYEGPLGDIREALEDGDDIVYSPLSEVMLPPPWHRGRVVLGGDAAHACAPHTTQGAAMALEDAVVLADELGTASDLQDALVAYTERRYPRAKFVQEVSRGILDAEMAIDAETLPVAIEQMAAELPGQLGGVDDFLNQPA